MAFSAGHIRAAREEQHHVIWEVVHEELQGAAAGTWVKQTSALPFHMAAQAFAFILELKWCLTREKDQSTMSSIRYESFVTNHETSTMR